MEGDLQGLVIVLVTLMLISPAQELGYLVGQG